MSRTKDYFYECIDELIKNHPCKCTAQLDLSRNFVMFTKKVADDGDTQVYVNFDVDGKPLDGFLTGDMCGDEDSWNFETITDIQYGLRLTKDERAFAEV